MKHPGVTLPGPDEGGTSTQVVAPSTQFRSESNDDFASAALLSRLINVVAVILLLYVDKPDQLGLSPSLAPSGCPLVGLLFPCMFL